MQSQTVLSISISRGHPVFSAEAILYDTYHGSKICESKLLKVLDLLIFKNKCFLDTVACYRMTGQMLGSSSEAQLIHPLMRLSTIFQFGIILISYWFG